MTRTLVQHDNERFVYKVHVNDNMIDFQWEESDSKKKHTHI